MPCLYCLLFIISLIIHDLGLHGIFTLYYFYTTTSFLKLNSSHIEYVLDRMRENTTYVRNIKKYLLAALYNAPATIDSYYTSLVSHDMYGGGDRR